ncbi:MAG TPA: Wzz/FepE/Etk N-terminal domain-containing protein [Mycobacteriales bacterium]|nr:Wzz/FepE/Etk N-terminal domain-containing protein [Mycobacteriales bacterium]
MDQPVELQLNHWLRVLARRAQLMAVIVLVGASLGLLAAALAPRTYTARTTVLLQQPLSEQTGDPTSNLQVLSQLAASDLVQHDTRLLVGEGPDLAVSASADGQVLTFRATASTSGAAQQAADAYAAAFRQLSSNAVDRQLAAAQSSLQEQVRQLDTALGKPRLTNAERAVLVSRRADYAAALNRLLVRRELLSGGQALVVSPAKAPEHADSRHAAIHLALGTLLGLVAAAALAGLVDRREDRVRSEQDLLRRLSEGPQGRELSLMPLVPAGRRDTKRGDPDALPAEPGSVGADTYAVFRASLTTAATGPTRVVMVAEPVRDGGASAVGLNLAAAFSRAGRRTVVASLDFREDGEGGVIERVLTPPQRRSRKIVRLARGRDEEATESAEHATSEVTRLFPLTFRTVPGDENLAVVTSGQLKSADELVAGRPVQVFLESLVGIADVAVLEVPPVMTFPDAMLVWPYCHDGVLVVHIGQSRTGDVLRAVERLGTRSQQSWAVAVVEPGRRGGPPALRALLVPPVPEASGRDVVTTWPATSAVDLTDEAGTHTGWPTA